MPEVTVTVNLAKIGRFAKSLEKADATRLRKEIRVAVNKVGGDALNRARSNSRWSTGHTSREAKKTRDRNAVGNVHQSIPSSISLKTSFAVRGASVTMKTDPKKAPHAYLYERGSKGGGNTSIRHPTFGNKQVWRTNRTRPYFYKAVWDHRDELKNELKDAISVIAREAGFTG